MSELSCAATRDAMLEAELDELRGLGDSDVAHHIRSCAECRASAALLLSSYAKLGASLDSLRARAQHDIRTSIPRKHRKLYWVPIPLAAAAVLALLVIPRQNANEQLPRIDALAQLMFTDEPIATPPPGKQAMVIERSDMTIVWLYSQETP